MASAGRGRGAGRVGARRTGSAGAWGVASCAGGQGCGLKAVVVPVENLPEASLVDGIEVWGVRTLSQLQGWLSGSARLDERTSGVVLEYYKFAQRFTSS
jgi:predicted ATPase with chaperone activity